MAHYTFGAAPILPHDLGTSPILEAVLQVLVLLNGTRKDLAAFPGLALPEGIALVPELLSSAETRIQQLRALTPPSGMGGLFNGLLQVLEIWKDTLGALRGGDPSRAAALASDARRKSEAIMYLLQVNLPPRSGALRTSTKRHSYLN